jgi:hypothetical protein
MERMSDLTPDEIRRVRAYLAQEDRASRVTAENSRRSFFGWLVDVGFSWIVDKIITVAWVAIRSIFGF